MSKNIETSSCNSATGRALTWSIPDDLFKNMGAASRTKATGRALARSIPDDSGVPAIFFGWGGAFVPGRTPKMEICHFNSFKHLMKV